VRLTTQTSIFKNLKNHLPYVFSVAQALKGYLFTGDNAFMRMASFIAVSSSWLEG
jgi:hypothetical protein